MRFYAMARRPILGAYTKEADSVTYMQAGRDLISRIKHDISAMGQIAPASLLFATRRLHSQEQRDGFR